MTNKNLTIPTIHLNGTSKQSLIDDYVCSANAVKEALDTLITNSPNQRDYYPLGDNAWKQAVAEHADRITRLRSVYDELAFLYNAISDLP